MWTRSKFEGRRGTEFDDGLQSGIEADDESESESERERDAGADRGRGREESIDRIVVVVTHRSNS